MADWLIPYDQAVDYYARQIRQPVERRGLHRSRPGPGG